MTNPEDTFNRLMNDYNFILSIDAWSTHDLVQLSSAIDGELQRRHDEYADQYDDGVMPWDDEEDTQ